MRLLRPYRKREWSRQDKISLGVTVAIVGITLYLMKEVYEEVSSLETGVKPAELNDTCLGLWGCTGPTDLELLLNVVAVAIAAGAIALAMRY